MKIFASPNLLQKRGVLGMNARNANYIQRYNKRKFYPNADSKLKTKKILEDANLPTPELLAVIPSVSFFNREFKNLDSAQSFVIKPEHGSGGEGVLVLERDADRNFIRSSGEIVAKDYIKAHIANIVSGLYSLGGQPDVAVIESRVEFDPVFSNVTYRGVPDIRIVTLLGVPAMAMLRLPTVSSAGRANLHQGAIGVGIDLASGKTKGGVQGSRFISTHPDTKASIEDITIPYWDHIMEIACQCCQLFKLDYLGIDIVLDKEQGPEVLEVNVRPGLAVQLANRCGLKKRLTLIQRSHMRYPSVERRAAFAKKAISRIGN